MKPIWSFSRLFSTAKKVEKRKELRTDPLPSATSEHPKWVVYFQCYSLVSPDYRASKKDTSRGNWNLMRCKMQNCFLWQTFFSLILFLCIKIGITIGCMVYLREDHEKTRTVSLGNTLPSQALRIHGPSLPHIFLETHYFNSQSCKAACR